MKSEAIDYAVDGVEFSGRLVWDDADTSARPLVLMAPDWMGIGTGALEMAAAIAGRRFCVFVADLYGKGILPGSIEAAGSLANPLKADVPTQRVRIAAALRAAQNAVMARGLGSNGVAVGGVGFCFGGTNVLELARMGADLRVAISVHGELMTPFPAREGELKSKIVVLHGALDPVAPKAHRDAIEAEMNAAKADWWEATFGEAVHSFTNPRAALPNISMYHEKAARWALRIIEQTLIEELAS